MYSKRSAFKSLRLPTKPRGGRQRSVQKICNILRVPAATSPAESPSFTEMPKSPDRISRFLFTALQRIRSLCLLASLVKEMLIAVLRKFLSRWARHSPMHHIMRVVLVLRGAWLPLDINSSMLANSLRLGAPTTGRPRGPISRPR